jgi:SRSO17 transposase
MLAAEEAWTRLSAGAGSKGERLYDWACVSLPDPDTQEAERAGRWLLLRRNIDDPTELAYYLAYGPIRDAPRERADPQVAGSRWAIEDGFEAAKGEVGLDEYEVLKWAPWHRHITLCLLAHAYLAVLRSAAKDAASSVKPKTKKGIATYTSDPADGGGGQTVGGGYG